MPSPSRRVAVLAATTLTAAGLVTASSGVPAAGQPRLDELFQGVPEEGAGHPRPVRQGERAKAGRSPVESRTTPPVGMRGAASPARPLGITRLALTKSCVSWTGGLVELDRDNTHYRITGECKTLRITGDNISVDAWYAADLQVFGEHNSVRGNILYDTVVKGRANRVEANSMRRLRTRGRHHTVVVAGLAERVKVRGRHTTVRADRALRVVTRGKRHTVRTGTATAAKVVGDRNTLRHRRLGRLRLAGKRNTVVVKRGSTQVRARGRHNRLP